MCVVFFAGHIGVLQKLCDEVGAELAEFTGGAGGVALLKHALDVVFGKEFHVFTQNVEVGECCKIVTVVCSVIPNVEVVANFAPILNGGAELRTSVTTGFGENVVEVTVDGRKTDANVFCRLGNLRGGQRVVVSQRVNGYVGVERRNRFRDAVYKAEQRTCGTTFFLNNCAAFFTFAIVGVIVLGYRKNFSIGVFCQFFENVGENFIVDFFICHAGVYGIGGVVNVKLCQFANGVHKQIGCIGQATAKLLAPRLCPTADNVNAVFGRPSVFGVISLPVIPVCLTQFKGRIVVQNHTVGNVNRTGLTNLKFRCEEAHVCTFFKISVNTVKNTAAVAANNGEALGAFLVYDGAYAVGILAKRFIN